MTIRQRKAIKNVVENGGNVSRAMIDAGYDPTTAKNPSKLTDSKGWMELMEQYLPDDKLLKAPADALNANKWNDFTGEREPDHAIRLKAADQGFRLKGKLKETNIGNQFNTVILNKKTQYDI